MDWLARLFRKYRSPAQMRRQALEWAITINGQSETGKDASWVIHDAQELLRFWIGGEGRN